LLWIRHRLTYDVRAILARHFLLKHLPPPAIDEVARLATTHTYRPEEVVFVKGDPGTAMMAVLRGRVRICAYSAEGREVVLNVMVPGEVFGEIAMIDGGPRTADAFAMEPSVLLALSRRDFLPFLERNPQVCVQLLEVMCQRLRWTSTQVEDSFFLDLRARLAKRLLHLATRDDETPAAAGLPAVKFSQAVLANMIGTSREAVNKQLRAWEQLGRIRLKRNLVVLCDVEALQRDAEGAQDGEAHRVR
jgi:CRP-like cAMP-binding protein